MKPIEKTLKYYELLMTYDDTSNQEDYYLPSNFHFEFYKNGDEYEWVKIHILSGEFTSFEMGLKYFHDFFDSFKDELSRRCIFIVSETGEKIGTATISLLSQKEDEYDASVDWVAIKKEYQGMGLSKPLISRFITLANELGHNKLMLHTQTHTWLAAKLYLDFGFEPYKVDENIVGWQILKTITNHSKLKAINTISNDELYSNTAIKVFEKLIKIHGDNFNYEIWYKNSRNDVYVTDFNKYYEYKYYCHNNEVELEKIKEKDLYTKNR